MPLTRRQFARVLVGSGVGSLLVACQGPAASSTTSGAAAAPTQPNPLVKPRVAGADLTAVLASSEVAQGRNRFAVGLIDARNQPLVSGAASVEFFKLLANGQAEKRADAAATFRAVGAPTKGIWVSQTTFSEPGKWGAQVALAVPDGQPKTARLNFDVIPRFSAPGYDEPAVRSASLTERDVNGDLSRLCSNTPPCSLHAQSIADALAAARKPLVLLFATPALCTSATCAPELQAVQQLHDAYAEAADFIHVELYQYPFDSFKVVSAVDDWRLPSDPWAFIIDRGGTVRDRFEGAAPFEELEPALRSVLP